MTTLVLTEYQQVSVVGSAASPHVITLEGIDAPRVITLAGGIQGASGAEIELQKSATHIQWKYTDEAEWTDLIAIDDLKGDTGATGAQGATGSTGATGPQGSQGIQGATGATGAAGTNGTNGADGADGREVELQKSITHIQWRYAGDVVWTDLVALTDIKGDTGATGAQGAQGTTGATGPAGADGADGASGNAVSVSVDFGASFTDKAQTVVTGEAWVTPTSKITAQVLTPAGTDPDEMYLLDIKVVISDIVNGVGFTVTLYSRPEAKGVFSVMCLGV